MAVYHFRYAAQTSTETIDQHVTRLKAVDKSCESVDTENEIRCDDLERISGPGCRSTYMHAYATGVTSDGRSTLTTSQNVETEFITHVLHNNQFSRAVATPYFSDNH